MSFELVWHPAALAALYRMHWRTATTVDAGIINFARTGEGALESVPPYYHLRIGSHVAKLIVDREARAVTVIGLYRAR